MSVLFSHGNLYFSSVQFSSVTQSYLTLCDPVNCSIPGLPVHHQLPEFTQTHVHRVGDAIQPSHLLSSPPLPVPNISQHQGLFKWVSYSHQVAKVLEFPLQHQSFQWTPRTDLLLDGLVGSSCSPRDSQESSTPQSKSINSSALSFLHSPTRTSITVDVILIIAWRWCLQSFFSLTWIFSLCNWWFLLWHHPSNIFSTFILACLINQLFKAELNELLKKNAQMQRADFSFSL